MVSLIPLIFEDRFVPFPTWSWTETFFILVAEPQTNTLKNIQNFLMAQYCPIWIDRWMKSKNCRIETNRQKFRVDLISGLKYHLSGIACFPTWPLPTWPYFAKLKNQALCIELHSDSKLNRKRNFRLFDSYLYFRIIVSNFWGSLNELQRFTWYR